ncbi:MAG: hypothetical protein MUE60_07410 [Candidatus Eisenbacteria bacterium]|nr:hypothetical protein [Candidatus Eisenbacteria bacterium]
MKHTGVLLSALVALGYAYTWAPLGPPGLTAYDWHALDSMEYASILCADTSIVMEGSTGWEAYSHQGLPCLSALPLDSASVLVALGNGGDGDGVYRFDLESHGFSLVHPCSLPRSVQYSAGWNAWFAGGEGGLSVSTNAVDWLALDDFAGMPCRAVAVAESSLVMAADTSVFFAHDAHALEFSGRIDLGLVEHNPITEASGIVASRRNAGVLWTQNDSGNPNTIYAMSENGTHLGAYTISGATNRDWEDIAIAYDAEGDRYLIYVGDIGDNNGAYVDKYVYLVEEPEVSPSQPPVTVTLHGMQRITFQYPGGVRYNAETLLIDPLTNDLYVVTKQGGGIATVFRAAFPQSTAETIVLEQVAGIAGLGGTAVGGDISPSGREILIKTYGQMYHWRRGPGQTVGEAFGSARTALPYVQEPQGEAVCWMANLMGYHTISEEQGGVPAHLYLYRREAWQQAQPPMFPVTDIAVSGAGSLVAVCPGTSLEAGLWCSADQGATWAQQLSTPNLGAVAVDSHGVVFLGWHGDRDTTGVAVWAADVASLTPVNQGLPSLSINRLRVDLRDPSGAMACCTDSGAVMLTGYFEPMELGIGCVAPDTACIEWPPVPAATHYDLYRSPLAFQWPDLPWYTVAVPDTTLTVSGVVLPDTSLFFMGRARNPSQVTPWSNTVGVLNRSLP